MTLLALLPVMTAALPSPAPSATTPPMSSTTATLHSVGKFPHPPLKRSLVDKTAKPVFSPRSIDVEAAWRRFAPMVHRRCAAMLKNDDDAADATQEVFVKLVLHKARLTDDAPASLLWTMATRECLTRLRRRRRRPEDGEALLEAIAAVDDPEREVFVHRALETVFAGQPEALRVTTRTIAVWTWVDRMTLAEVAAASGLSVSGVRKRLRTLRARVIELFPDLALPEDV